MEQPKKRGGKVPDKLLAIQLLRGPIPREQAEVHIILPENNVPEAKFGS